MKQIAFVRGREMARVHRSSRWAIAAATGVVAVALVGTAPSEATSGHRHPGARAVSIFPSNDLTVRDRGQKTGLRIALPADGCATVSSCGMIARLDELDGFDLDPRIAVTFDRPVDPAAAAGAITIRRGHGPAIGVERVVYDAATHTVYAHPTRQLDPGTTYRLTVRGAGRNSQETFTTMSATDGLLDLARRVHRTRPAELRVEATVAATTAPLEYLQDTGAAALNPVPVPTTGLTGRIVIGSFEAPSWLREDGTIEQTPTRDRGPRAVGTARLPFVLTTPAGRAPRGGWPVAVFGHGFTGNLSNMLAEAEYNARRGIATIATTVPGHGFGPCSQWRITDSSGVRTVPAYGRGRDVDGVPGIGSTDGASPRVGTAASTVGFRDTLRQASLDNMSLLRAVAADRRLGLSSRSIDYYGISFGGIFGTMTVAADPSFDHAVLTVPGGPISEIARLSPDFRPLAALNLQAEGLLNGGTVGFTESLPLPGEGPVTEPAAGSLAIQAFLAHSTWLQRAGSPETFAPLVRHRDALYQVARGDRTVANPTSFTLLRAGHLAGRTSLYRNDLTAASASNPHGFPGLDPVFATARAQGLGQTAEFLATGRTIDPDGPGPVWETPIRNVNLLRTLGF